MSLPKQSIGLTNFSTSISKCPPNPDAIHAIVFTKCDNLSVVNGAKTEIQISLTDFFIPVKDAAKTSFTLLGKKDDGSPFTISKLDLGGVSSDDTSKFITLFPQFGKGASGNSLYLEWATEDAIEKGTLLVTDPIEQGGNVSFSFFQINRMEFSNGGYLDYDGTGTGCIYAATNGGLLKWDGSHMTLWNTQNSNSTTDFISSIAIDSSNTVWIASNDGIMQFNENSTSVNFKHFGAPPSQNILDIELFSPNLGVAGTDKGLYVFTRDGFVNETYNIYNSPLLKHNYISKIAVSDDNMIFAGTTGGVYALDYSAKKWCKYPLNSSFINGWSGPSSVTSLASYNKNLYVGTTGGIVVIPYVGITGATSSYAGITASYLSSPLSDNISSLRVAAYGVNNYELYVGHGMSGGVSIYNFGSSTWNFQDEISSIIEPVTDILPNYLSQTGNKTLFLGSTGDTGIVKMLTGTTEFDNVPSSEDSIDILVTIPAGGSFSGNMIDNSKLYSIEQPVHIVFSRSMDTLITGESFQSFFSLKKNIDGSGATVSGNWSVQNDGRLAIYTPSSSLDRASGYRMSLAKGSKPSDGSYLSSSFDVGFYTEDIVPETGWNTMGKMLTLSGSDTHYVKNIYLRNPQFMDVNVIALIGK